MLHYDHVAGAPMRPRHATRGRPHRRLLDRHRADASGGPRIGALLGAPARPFTARELELIRTFADQAVIAIQNARLFTETKEALEQQTATAEVLQVISGSVADTQPVFDKILDSCQRLFAATALGIYLVDDAGMLHTAAFAPRARSRGARSSVTQQRPLEGTASGVAIRERRVVHFPTSSAHRAFPRRCSRRAGGRATLARVRAVLSDRDGRSAHLRLRAARCGVQRRKWRWPPDLRRPGGDRIQNARLSARRGQELQLEAANHKTCSSPT